MGRITRILPRRSPALARKSDPEDCGLFAAERQDSCRDLLGLILEERIVMKTVQTSLRVLCSCIIAAGALTLASNAQADGGAVGCDMALDICWQGCWDSFNCTASGCDACRGDASGHNYCESDCVQDCVDKRTACAN